MLTLRGWKLAKTIYASLYFFAYDQSSSIAAKAHFSTAGSSLANNPSVACAILRPNLRDFLSLDVSAKSAIQTSLAMKYCNPTTTCGSFFALTKIVDMLAVESVFLSFLDTFIAVLRAVRSMISKKDLVFPWRDVKLSVYK